MKGYKRIYDFTTLEVGKNYFVICGVWTGDLIYCGHFHNDKEFTFTYGASVDAWKNSFNIVACKSRLRVYKTINSDASEQEQDREEDHGTEEDQDTTQDMISMEDVEDFDDEYQSCDFDSMTSEKTFLSAVYTYVKLFGVDEFKKLMKNLDCDEIGSTDEMHDNDERTIVYYDDHHIRLTREELEIIKAALILADYKDPDRLKNVDYLLSLLDRVLGRGYDSSVFHLNDDYIPF